jgi:RNAse (barnase) inhibitor barstar
LFLNKGYGLFFFDCVQWASLEDFHDTVKRVLSFPDYYGRNMDAFNDYLRDLRHFGGIGTVLVFNRFDSFASKFPSPAQTILDIIADNSRTFLLWNWRLLALVQSDDPRISFDPVGASPVIWNPSEWLNKNRGL